MNQLLYLRKQYGEVFVTELPDGQIVPWKPLSTGEFLHYNSTLLEGRYPRAYIENEIFTKCVLDRILVDSIDKLKAGVIQAVVDSILTFSGPQHPNELNYMLNLQRVGVNDAMHEIVGMICQAFPAYRPEEVYEMDYTTFMQRAALAERKLLRSGLLNEPVVFEVPQDQEEYVKEQEEQQKRLERNKNMIDDFYKQQGIKVPESAKKAREEKRKQILDPSPVRPPPPPPPTTERTVITKSDMIEHASFMSGHERDVVHQIKATDETAQIYQDYLEQLKESGTLKIKTDEERKAAAQKRMEENKQKLLAQQKAATEAAKKELPELLKVREEARKRKAKKAARRRR